MLVPLLRLAADSVVQRPRRPRNRHQRAFHMRAFAGDYYGMMAVTGERAIEQCQNLLRAAGSIGTARGQGISNAQDG